MVVNLDLLIIENCIVDLFLLYITAQTLRILPGFKLLLIASLLGSLYIILFFYPMLSFLLKLPFKILTAFIINILAFYKKNLIFYIKSTVIFIVYSMLLAGICIFIQFNINGYDEINGVMIDFSYKYLMLSIMIFYVIIHRTVLFIKDRKDLKTLIYDVDIVTKNSVKSVKAFFDTGNELREPATNLPVLVVEKKFFKDINLERYERFYIPFQVLNGHSGALEAFEPEYINIHMDETINKRKVIVALCDNKLSNFNDYEALLSRGTI